jgi:hypothetical protein
LVDRTTASDVRSLLARNASMKFGADESEGATIAQDATAAKPPKRQEITWPIGLLRGALM